MGSSPSAPATISQFFDCYGCELQGLALELIVDLANCAVVLLWRCVGDIFASPALLSQIICRPKIAAMLSLPRPKEGLGKRDQVREPSHDETKCIKQFGPTQFKRRFGIDGRHPFIAAYRK